MKPSFFSGCHTEKIQVEFYPTFFRVAKAPIFSKLKIGCRLKGRFFKIFCSFVALFLCLRQKFAGHHTVALKMCLPTFANLLGRYINKAS